MRYAIVFSFLLVLTGCASQIKMTEPNRFATTIPEINTINEVEIGTSLVSKEGGYKYKALKLSKDAKIRTGNILKDVKEGEVFINDSYTSTYDLYSSINPTAYGSTYGIALSKSGGKAVTFYKSGAGIKFSKPNLDLEYSELLTPRPKKEYYKQDFIYNGKVGNAIKFTYREFADDLARPAFTQDLQYDFTESNIIGFRGLRIEILSATNIKIQYKVLSYYTE
ncbi:hypothetical protein BH10BAC2_BH10BAC2_21930 [soil metagenome]